LGGLGGVFVVVGVVFCGVRWTNRPVKDEENLPLSEELATKGEGTKVRRRGPEREERRRRISESSATPGRRIFELCCSREEQEQGMGKIQIKGKKEIGAVYIRNLLGRLARKGNSCVD